jgi:hypothetical protein
VNITYKLFVPTSFALLVAACHKDDTPPAANPSASTDNTNGENAAVYAPERRAETASATNSIAESRCAREERCENIGENKKFSSNDDCMARIRADWKDDLNARECPRGVNQPELRECLTEIRNEDCSSPFDTLSRVAACTSGQICQG